MRSCIWIGLLLLTTCFSTLAGDPTWNSGYVILSDGQRINGQLCYNWKAEVIQVRTGDGITKAYSASRADSFAYFDAVQNVLRKFDAVSLPASADISRLVFMEECTPGHFTVYRRLRHAKELIKIARPSLFQEDPDLVKDLDNFVYFIFDPNGGMTSLHNFESTVWPQMLNDYRPQLTDYMQQRQLDPALTLGRLLLINHYNHLRTYHPLPSGKSATIGDD